MPRVSISPDVSPLPTTQPIPGATSLGSWLPWLFPCDHGSADVFQRPKTSNGVGQRKAFSIPVVIAVEKSGPTETGDQAKLRLAGQFLDGRIDVLLGP